MSRLKGSLSMALQELWREKFRPHKLLQNTLVHWGWVRGVDSSYLLLQGYPDSHIP